MNATTVVTDHALIPAATPRVDVGGTMWRLRSLVAMGHNASRIACALHVSPKTIQSVLRGDTTEVSPAIRDVARALWTAWWDKRPPERTRTERRLASAARRHARLNDWCPPLGLDEDQLDDPGYRPYSHYRHATGTGIAADFHPAARQLATKPASASQFAAECTPIAAVHSRPPEFANGFGPPPSSLRQLTAPEERRNSWIV